jgi:toxin ParE1/3/4
VKKPRLVFSNAAVADILEQADWYRTKSGRRLALRWERAVTSAIKDIVRHPAAGFGCTCRSLELQDVRRTPITKFPKHLLFYRFTEEEVSCCGCTAHATWRICFPEALRQAILYGLRGAVILCKRHIDNRLKTGVHQASVSQRAQKIPHRPVRHACKRYWQS